MPEFKDAFAKLSNKYIDSEIYTSNLVSKAGLKNDYNISVYSNYNHKTKTLDFVINNYDPNKFYYILVASRNPKTPAK
jgi:hypothetical protein